MEQTPKNVHDYVEFLKRRKGHLLIPFLIVVFLGGAAAMLLPSIYKSSTTILIEGQQIPTEFVRTTVTSFAEERIQIITQRIMSRARLLEIINRFNLYPSLKKRRTTEEIIHIMRDDIELETISADVIDSRTGRQTQATIAFTLSYQGKAAEVIQRVTNVLASLYLEENLKTRERQAKDTSHFLEQEITSLSAHLNKLEKKIASFKEKHMTDLPELMHVNLQTLARIERDIMAADQDCKMLEDRKIYLQGQLETIDPHSPWVSFDGVRVPSPEERLQILKAELISFSANHTDLHPDVIKMKQEIKELEKHSSRKEELVERYKRLTALKTDLEVLQSTYKAQHPDVMSTHKKMQALEADIAQLSAEKKNPSPAATIKPDNPAYINLATQIESVSLQIESRKKEREELKNSLQDYQQRLEKTPQVEKAYSALTRDHENTWAQYQETMKKLMEARVAQGMEQEQKGERFTIIDPAQYPEKPFKPNRLAILLISVILGLGASVGYASIAEFMDQSIKSADDLFNTTGISVLASVPYITTQREQRTRRIKRLVIATVCVIAVACGIALFHVYVMDLNVFWARATRFLAKRFVL